MESRYFGLRISDLRHLAYQFAVRNGITHPFNDEKGKAGKDWVLAFLKRNSRLSLRTPEKTSIARATAFNRHTVSAFFSLLIELYDHYKFSPSQIYNVDETGITTVPNKPSKVIATKGKKQVGTLSSAERGTTTTSVICFNAAGRYIPPLMIFPRARENLELLEGTPPDTKLVCHPSGWMNTEIFCPTWLDHFLRHAQPTADQPILLIPDGHASHTKNIALLETARKKHVHIICLPPHTSHRLQPLDLDKNAISGFAKTGIWALNPHIFPDEAFAASETTNRPAPEKEDSCSSESDDKIPLVLLREPAKQSNKKAVPSCSKDVEEEVEVPLCSSEVVAVLAPDKDVVSRKTDRDKEVNKKVLPSCSKDADKKPKCFPKVVLEPVSCSSVASCSSNIASPRRSPKGLKETGILSQNQICSPRDIIPVPQVNETNKQKPTRNKGKTAVLTASPYYRELLDKNSPAPDPQKIDNIVKVLFGNKKKGKPGHHQGKRKRVGHVSAQGGENDDDTRCILCDGEFLKSSSGESWISCSRYEGWAHEKCTAYDRQSKNAFVCDFCE
ncbi:hypothetical protein PPYR_15170 [Photinus pyralis]|uniref:DDE-1 domain-containing protein n=1 Tax=Photinus pyralis TaxID=7054 RepID=A0A5N3ZZJ6_PHOPY|nr:hypothetical protein PPYR_15170 [Photinus pyralis]